MTLRPTRHYYARQSQRDVDDAMTDRALAGRVLEGTGVTFCVDPLTRTTLVIKCGAIVTVMRAKPSQVKRRFGLNGAASNSAVPR